MQALVATAVNCFTTCLTGMAYLLSSMCSTGQGGSKNSNKKLPEIPLEVSKLKKHILIHKKEGKIRKERRRNFFLPFAFGNRGGAIVAGARLFHKCKMRAHAFLLCLKQSCGSLGAHGEGGGVWKSVWALKNT